MARPFVWFPSDRSGHEKTRPFGRAGRVAQGFESGQSAGGIPCRLLAGRAMRRTAPPSGSPGEPLDGFSYGLLGIGERTSGYRLGRPTCCSLGEHALRLKRWAFNPAAHPVRWNAGRSVRRVNGTVGVPLGERRAPQPSDGTLSVPRPDD
jgi:hypothetical protein